MKIFPESEIMCILIVRVIGGELDLNHTSIHTTEDEARLQHMDRDNRVDMYQLINVILGH